jgi:hypothetical protein
LPKKRTQKGQPDHIGPLKTGLPCAVRKERTFWEVASLRQNVFPVLCELRRQSDDGLLTTKAFISFLKPILSR